MVNNKYKYYYFLYNAWSTNILILIITYNYIISNNITNNITNNGPFFYLYK